MRFSLRSSKAAFSKLKIVDVRPKPEGLSASLKGTSTAKTISRDDRISLQSKGFYFSSDGQLLSNEGEMLVYTEDGVIYTLHFGEVVVGGGAGEVASIAESRYLFISTDIDLASYKEPSKPANYEIENRPDSLQTADDIRNREMAQKWEKWKREIDVAKKLSGELNQRFADWYYVISSGSFENLRLRRSDLVVAKSDKS